MADRAAAAFRAEQLPGSAALPPSFDAVPRTTRQPYPNTDPNATADSIRSE
jgi:hypothetical protein